MQVVATITNVATGETREHHDDLPGDPLFAHSTALYQWTDGNYSCDCNRALFFARAAGDESPADPPCGEAAFLVQLRDAETGEILLDEPAGDLEHRD